MNGFRKLVVVVLIALRVMGGCATVLCCGDDVLKFCQGRVDETRFAWLWKAAR